MPAIYPYRYFAADGGLMSYGVNTAEEFRRAATYVDRILRGASPGELPVQAPNKFEFVINLKTAKALGLGLPANAPRHCRRGDRIGLSQLGNWRWPERLRLAAERRAVWPARAKRAVPIAATSVLRASAVGLMTSGANPARPIAAMYPVAPA